MKMFFSDKARIKCFEKFLLWFRKCSIAEMDLFLVEFLIV